MNCDDLKGLLPGWHFSELSADERAQVESHLPGCPGCLSEFITLKRSVELAEAGPRPSPEARARLREAVALELAPRGKWWEPALALSFAAASVVLAVFVLDVLR